jgi:hypothetical protein
MSTSTATVVPGESTRSFSIVGFGIFVALSLPLVMAALMGEWIDAGSWLIPLALPAGLSFYPLLLKPPHGEAARQAADISRHDV